MRQSATYTNRIDGNLVRTPRPLTKGKALMLAREILGPDAKVFHDYFDGRPFSIESRFGSDIQFSGVSWEDALAMAKASPEAKAWTEAQIQRDNEIALAVNSLKAKTIEFYKDRLNQQKEILVSAFQKIKVRVTGCKSCKCGRTISANKGTCLRCSHD